MIARPPREWPTPKREVSKGTATALKIAVGIMAGTLGMALGDIYASSLPLHINAHLGPLFFDNQSTAAFGGFAIGGVLGYEATSLGIDMRNAYVRSYNRRLRRR